MTGVLYTLWSFICPTPFTIFVVGYYVTFEKQTRNQCFQLDSAFSGFRRTLDGQMKILRSTGHGVQAKQAEPLTIDEEDQYTPVTIIFIIYSILFISLFFYTLEPRSFAKKISTSGKKIINLW